MANTSQRQYRCDTVCDVPRVLIRVSEEHEGWASSSENLYCAVAGFTTISWSIAPRVAEATQTAQAVMVRPHRHMRSRHRRWSCWWQRGVAGGTGDVVSAAGASRRAFGRCAAIRRARHTDPRSARDAQRSLLESRGKNLRHLSIPKTNLLMSMGQDY
jgi:hypothetical protein